MNDDLAENGIDALSSDMEENGNHGVISGVEINPSCVFEFEYKQVFV